MVKRFVRKTENYLFDHGVRPFWAETKPIGTTISLIVPCYNVGKYIRRFLSSIIAQTSGLNGLEVLLIDDGSTDDTAAIAKKWVNKHPGIFKYFYQENQGLCGARNTGLTLASGEWISFPDPDDFFDRKYLETVGQAILEFETNDLALACCRFYPYLERTDEFKDNHSLSFRFKNEKDLVPVNDMGNFMQLSVNSAFFRRLDVLRLELRFDPRIVPGFEDAQFVNRYLLHLMDSSVTFLREAKYYYRKRADESSLQDKARTRREFYINQPKFGWLSVLKEAQETLGYVPKFLQRTILYDTIGRFRSQIKRPHAIDFLSIPEKVEYRELMRAAMRYVDQDIVQKTNLPGYYEDLRVGILNLYFASKRHKTTVYVSHFDEASKLIRIYYDLADPRDNSVIYINGVVQEKTFKKTTCHKFVDQVFFYRHVSWIPWSEGDLVVLFGKQKGKIKIQAAALALASEGNKLPGPDALIKKPSNALFASCWLLMDRTDKADDNAEHFYKYLKKKQKHINCFFVLSKSSTDWLRLQNAGFDLIEYGSQDHSDALKNAILLISSHADRFIRRPFPDISPETYKFVFIQHGVTKDDQSEWFNEVMPTILATATTSEFKSMVTLKSNYQLTRKEVKLTGFPRHDALQKMPLSKKTIFVMPTWRESLFQLGANGSRTIRRDVKDSEYVMNWSSFLSSGHLKSLAESYSLEIIFCPHPNLVKHIDIFSVPEYVRVTDSTKIVSLQSYFAEMAVMVTDFSSVAFDAGYLDKAVIYFQFDEEEFFRGHIYGKGYFSYRADGFGPVVTDAVEAVENIDIILSGKENSVYQENRLKTFPYRDGRSCDRLFKYLKPYTMNLDNEQNIV